MSFPRYPNYKPSGVDWLGEVPEDWEITRMKYVASLKGRLGWQNLRADEYTEEGPFLVTSEHLSNDRVDWDHCYHVSEERYAMAPEIQLRPGDLLMMKDGAAMGKLGYIDQLPGPACLNSHLLLFRPRDCRVTNRFLYYVLGSPSFTTYMLQERTGSTFFGISQESIGAFKLALPPQESLHAVVSFLDSECAKIDALVAEQQRLIELLKEKRQAVAAHAVTKGLNSLSLTKTSGIEWLGDVPAHWTITRLGALFTEVRELGHDNLPILSVSIHDGVSDRELDEEELERKITRSDDRSKYKRVTVGDLVYNMMRAWQGAFGTVAVDGLVSPAYVVARPRTDLPTAFIELLLRTPQAVEEIRRHSQGVTDFRLRLYWDAFKDIRVAIPPRAEAIGICQAIGALDEQFAAVSTKVQASITLLQERRTALISASVTGKITVRRPADANAEAA